MTVTAVATPLPEDDGKYKFGDLVTNTIDGTVMPAIYQQFIDDLNRGEYPHIQHASQEECGKYFKKVREGAEGYIDAEEFTKLFLGGTVDNE